MKKTCVLKIVTKDFTHIVQSVILLPAVFNQPDLLNLAFLIGERGNWNQLWLTAKSYFQNISELRLMGMVHISAPGEENVKENPTNNGNLTLMLQLSQFCWDPSFLCCSPLALVTHTPHQAAV